MRTIIAGSRSIFDGSVLERALYEAPFRGLRDIEEVVCGCAAGADLLGYEWAKAKDVDIAYFPILSNGKYLGPIPEVEVRTNLHRSGDWVLDGNPMAARKRNQAMASYADALIALWDSTSGGTADMILRAHRRGLWVYVHTLEINHVVEVSDGGRR